MMCFLNFWGNCWKGSLPLSLDLGWEAQNTCFQIPLGRVDVHLPLFSGTLFLYLPCAVTVSDIKVGESNNLVHFHAVCTLKSQGVLNGGI